MSVTINISCLDRIYSGSDQKWRQSEYAMRAALYMRQYVPEDESTLKNSEPLNSNYENGMLMWNTPYAAHQYYVPMNHRNSKNPRATDHWDEAVKRNHMGELEEYVAAMYEGA